MIISATLIISAKAILKPYVTQAERSVFIDHEQGTPRPASAAAAADGRLAAKTTNPNLRQIRFVNMGKVYTHS